MFINRGERVKRLLSLVLALVLSFSVLMSSVKSFSEEVFTGSRVSEISEVYTPWVSAYENITAHEGNLTVDGTQTYVIENCTYIQTGNIYVRDYARLTVRNAQLQINQSKLWQYKIDVRDFGVLELERAHLVSQYGLNAYFVNSSRVSILNTSMEHDPLTYMHFEDSSQANVSSSDWPQAELVGHSRLFVANSSIDNLFLNAASDCNVTVSDSTIVGISVGNFDRRAAVQIIDLRTGFIENLDLDEEVYPLELSLILTRVIVKAWWVSVKYDVDVRILDSHLILFVSYYETSAHLSSLTPQFYNNSEIGRIRLVNTTIDQFMISAENSHLMIEDSSLHFLASGNSQVIFNHSSVDTHIYNFFGGLFFEDSTWRGGILVHYSNFFMDGNLTFKAGPPSFEWLETNITRNYNMFVRDTYGKPVTNASLLLESKDGTIIWDGSTDSRGRANFNLTFSDSNCTHWSSLKIFKEGSYNVTKNIGLLSDTPLLISLIEKPLGDINEDHMVNIQDVTIVTVAYGSKPGDKNWNIIADLDKSGEVNIVDVTLVTRDYGKTTSS